MMALLPMALLLLITSSSWRPAFSVYPVGPLRVCDGVAFVDDTYDVPPPGPP